MSIVSLRSRLRKIECRHRKGADPMFLVWGRTADDLRQAMEPLRSRVPSDQLVGAVWPYESDCPRPRWTSERDVSDQELGAIIDHLRAYEGDSEIQSDHRGQLVGMSDAELLKQVLSAPAFQVPPG